MTNKEKEVIKLKKRYLNLVYRINEIRRAGNDPSDDLMQEFANIERIVRLMSKALS